MRDRERKLAYPDKCVEGGDGVVVVLVSLRAVHKLHGAGGPCTVHPDVLEVPVHAPVPLSHVGVDGLDGFHAGRVVGNVGAVFGVIDVRASPGASGDVKQKELVWFVCCDSIAIFAVI